MTKRALQLFLAMVFGVFFFMSSCTSDTLVPQIPSPSQKVSFSGDIQPIFNQSCTGCHAPGLNSPNLTAGSSYQSLMSMHLIDTVTPANSILYKKVVSPGSMSSYCTAAQAQLILQWIKQGARDN